jgi:ABC-2 type transport system permease protein
MTTLTELTTVPATAEQVPTAASRRVVPPIPLGTVIAVELRKMFDTRSGFWMLSSIGILAVLATGAVILFAPDAELTYSTFASAIGFPMAIVLPMIAILSVTGEWSQRSGLTTFTLVPHRGRVVFAKAVGAVGVGVVSMVVAMVIGALGNVVGTAIAGVPTTWDASSTELLYIVLANVLGLLMGFTLGVLIRNSAGAIVAYFVYSLVLPTITGLLAAAQGWFRDLQPWVDFQYNQTGLFDAAGFTGEQWAQLGVTGALWLVLPMALGVWLVLRSEVK